MRCAVALGQRQERLPGVVGSRHEPVPASLVTMVAVICTVFLIISFECVIERVVGLHHRVFAFLLLNDLNSRSEGARRALLERLYIDLGHGLLAGATVGP